MPTPSSAPSDRRGNQHDLGAGLNLRSPEIDNHPSGPPKHGDFGQAERGVSIASTFLSGILAINAAQFIGLPFKMIDPKFYNEYIAFTKQSFAVLITTMTQWWSPTKVHVSGDASIPSQLSLKPDGSLECRFPERMVLMANHQLYTDWLYLWWIAYTSKMAGHVYIILKESIKNIPLIGWGSQFYNFIFLARNWEKDKPRFQEHLQQLSNPKDPMWLIIFPEGTNLSASTRESSRRWAEKNGIKDMRHQLLPRSTGLKFCLENLKDSTDWLYDCTIAYEGVPTGEYGQDIYTLQSSFFEGRPPKSVNMHWRRFRISSIPLHSDKAFEAWLRNRWKEKDHYLDYYQRTGAFPSTDPWKASSLAEMNKIKPAKSLEAQVKSGSWGEFLAIFAPITAFLTVLFLFYGASVTEMVGTGASDMHARVKQAQREGKLQADGGMPPSLAKKALKNARAADPNYSDAGASGTSAGKPQYGEWDAIRKALAQKNMEGVKSFAPKAPSTADSVSGHRSFSQPTKKAPTTTVPTTPSTHAAAAKKTKAPLKLDTSNEALTALLKRNLGKAQNSTQVAQQTIKLANGQTIRAPANEPAETKKGPVKLANGQTIRAPANEPAEAKKGPVKLANGLSIGGEKKAVPSSPLKLANGLAVGAKGPQQSSTPAPKTTTTTPAKKASDVATPKPLKKKPTPLAKKGPALTSTVLPADKKPQQKTNGGGASSTAKTPSLASGPTKSTASVATPAAPSSAAASKKPAPAAAVKKAPAPAQGQSNAPKPKMPLVVQETSRGPKEKIAPRKLDAVRARKDK
ncbi:acyltransferase-domain-containing protein [Diplodia corticola]|uniref:Acyltransferase-domain-containing protein n=1 Tax=Diplodia corticola TaxID=236234 RepID=A0A1J9QSW7_9PEZI|nr:acyltransferase-domain-containing protein [Diplodia corticola]OJD32054.1 acyltransferase-domain-containing protein [Diplodia corticola]